MQTIFAGTACEGRKEVSEGGSNMNTYGDRVSVAEYSSLAEKQIGLVGSPREPG